MYYIVQENLFKEEGHDKLISTLERFNIPHELVNVRPFLEEFDFKTDRKDVFAFGSLKLARLSEQYDWFPGTMITENHDYEVYSKHYKENLLNYDSKVVRFDDDFEWEYDQQFIRPCLDSKTFTGKVFEKHIWNNLKWRTYHHNKEMRKEFGEEYPILLTEDTLIQVSMPKKITQEVRCWVIDGKIVTQSTYRRGSFLVYDNIVDQDAIDFAQSMVDIFQLAKGFTIDVCLTENGWKIVECGSISCAGFYDADIQKLIMALEELFTPIKYSPSLDIMR